MSLARPDDHGFTLVEVLITVVLLGIGCTSMLTGLITASRGSGDLRGLADERDVLISSAERIMAAPYVECAGAAGKDSYKATGWGSVVLPAEESGANQATEVSVAIMYWDGNDFGTSCSYDNVTANPSGMQRIRLVSGRESVVIVKRR